MATTKNSPFVSELSTANLSTTNFSNLPALPDGEPAGMQRIIIPPMHLLTPHLHPDTNETTICLAGTGKVGIITPDTKSGPIGANLQESDFNENNVVFLPQGYPHYFMNVSTSEDLVLLLTFEELDFNIITLADILQQMPESVVNAAEQSVPNAQSSPIIKYQ